MTDTPENSSLNSTTAGSYVGPELEASAWNTHSSEIPEQNFSGEQNRPSWFGWIHQGLRANVLRPLRELPQGPTAWAMLLIVGSFCLVVTLASRYEFATHTTFSFRTWLFSWAVTGLLIAGIWLINGWGRSKSAHSSPTAAWYLLYTVAALPISIVSITLSALSARHHMPAWWLSGTWSAWVIFAAFWVWIACVSWRISKAVNRSTWVAVGILFWVLIVETLNSYVAH
jgi:hypothetical protein